MNLLGKRHYAVMCKSYNATLEKTENRNTLRKLCLLENSIFKYRKEEEATRIYDAIKFANERNENNSDNRDFLRRKTLLLNAAERYREIYRYNFNSEILN